MMFKRLGIFAVLAVCLFAIVIVMVGCEREDKIDPPIVPPVEETKVELTPMEKLAGTYSLVESTQVYVEGDIWKAVSGKLHLRPGGNGWLTTFEDEDGDSTGVSGPTWTANATTITFITSGDRWVEDYTWEGKVLTLAFFGDDDFARIEKWRKD